MNFRRLLFLKKNQKPLDFNYFIAQKITSVELCIVIAITQTQTCMQTNTHKHVENILKCIISTFINTLIN